MEIILIDLLGTLFGICVILMFFRTLWVMKKFKPYMIALGIILTSIASAILTQFLQNTVLLPVLMVAMVFILSLYFRSRIISKILFSFVFLAIGFSTEVLVTVVYFDLLGVSLEQAQGNILLYFIGVITSNLLALLVVFVIRVVLRGYRKEDENQFNWVMVLMPIQSVIICFVVYFYSIIDVEAPPSPLGIISVTVSLALVFITMFIVKNLQQAIIFKSEYKLAQETLKTQLNHYEKLYQAQNEIRTVRHDLNNNLTAISGFLKDGRMQEALAHIDSISSNISKVSSVTNSGIPALDAVIDAKIAGAEEHGIRINSKIWLDDDLNIDSFDLAGIVASALDNAIEGINRSQSGVEKSINLNISKVPDFISVLVENFSSGPVHDDFRTSKPDKTNHGFGIKQIKAVAEKYKGNVLINYDDESMKFSLKILLENIKM